MRYSLACVITCLGALTGVGQPIIQVVSWLILQGYGQLKLKSRPQFIYLNSKLEWYKPAEYS